MREDEIQEINPEVGTERKELEHFLVNKENIVESSPGRKCVDGRYQKEQSTGMIARPGGDYGYVLALISTMEQLKTGHTPTQLFDAVFHAVTKDGSFFYMHTDEHDDGDHIGCGHAAKPIYYNSLYRITSPDLAKEALVRARELTAQEADSGESPLIIWESLTGDHKEDKVIVVTGNEKTVSPSGTDSKGQEQMQFVYDAKRDAEFIDQKLLPSVVEELNIPVDLRDKFSHYFSLYSQIQLEATLQLLAPNLPRFSVNVDRDEPMLEELAAPESLSIDEEWIKMKFENEAHKIAA